MSKENQIVMGLRFGKKDIILKRWHELSKDVEGGQTCFYKLALMSYIKKIPIKIGVINPYMDVSKNDIIKTITFTKEDGELYTWIENQTGKKSSKIKDILTTCIDITAEKESITNYAILKKQLEGNFRFENENLYIPDQFKAKSQTEITDMKTQKKQPDKPKNDVTKENATTKSINNLVAGSMVRGGRK